MRTAAASLSIGCLIAAFVVSTASLALGGIRPLELVVAVVTGVLMLALFLRVP